MARHIIYSAPFGAIYIICWKCHVIRYLLRDKVPNLIYCTSRDVSCILPHLAPYILFVRNVMLHGIFQETIWHIVHRVMCRVFCPIWRHIYYLLEMWYYTIWSKRQSAEFDILYIAWCVMYFATFGAIYIICQKCDVIRYLLKDKVPDLISCISRDVSCILPHLAPCKLFVGKVILYGYVLRDKVPNLIYCIGRDVSSILTHLAPNISYVEMWYYMVCSERQSNLPNLMYCIWRDIPSILPNLAPNYDVLEVILYVGNGRTYTYIPFATCNVNICIHIHVKSDILQLARAMCSYDKNRMHFWYIEYVRVMFKYICIFL